MRLICDANFKHLVKVLFIATFFYSCLFCNVFLLNIIVISIQRYLLGTYVPYTVLDPGDIAVIKTDKNSCSHRVHILSWTYIFISICKAISFFKKLGTSILVQYLVGFMYHSLFTYLLLMTFSLFPLFFALPNHAVISILQCSIFI